LKGAGGCFQSIKMLNKIPISNKKLKIEYLNKYEFMITLTALPSKAGLLSSTLKCLTPALSSRRRSSLLSHLDNLLDNNI